MAAVSASLSASTAATTANNSAKTPTTMATTFPVLLRFGGHAMAAGCTLAEQHFATLDAAFRLVAAEWLDAATLSRTLLSDGPLGI